MPQLPHRAEYIRHKALIGFGVQPVPCSPIFVLVFFVTLSLLASHSLETLNPESCPQKVTKFSWRHCNPELVNSKLEQVYKVE